MEPTYEELLETNRNLSNQLVRMSDRLQQSAREIAAKAWDEGWEAGHDEAADDIGAWEQRVELDGAEAPNPYRQTNIEGL